MNHLTLPGYCLLIAACSLALMLRSIWTHADSLVLVALLGFLFFAWRAVVETRRCWPAFVEHRRRAAEARIRSRYRPPARNPPPPTDIH